VLGLLVAAVYLHQLRRPIVWLVVPMIFMLITVMWAMLLKLGDFYNGWQASRDAGNAS
jgi:carbon starvation protein CstA